MLPRQVPRGDSAFPANSILCEKVCGAGHSHVANSLCDIADGCFELVENDRARILFQRALAIYETGYGNVAASLALVEDYYSFLEKLGKPRRCKRPPLTRLRRKKKTTF